MQDQNSLATGNTLTNNPMWNPYSIRLSATWRAPAAFLVSGSYTIMAGPYSGPIIAQMPAHTPFAPPFGPATRVSSTGAPPPNPPAAPLTLL